MRIAVCDDSSRDIDHVKKLLEKYMEGTPELKLEVDYFLTSFLLLEDMDTRGAADIYILDIYIDAFDGIGLAKKIRSQDNNCSIVFLTSSDTHAVDAFEVRAAHYLKKPVDEADFKEAMDRCVERQIQKNRQPVLFCQTAEGLVGLPYNEIMYIESVRHIQVVVTKTKRIEARKALGKFWEVLQETPEFIMPHRSYIINQKYIHGINPQCIMLKNGEEIPLPRGKYKIVKDAFMEYTFNNSNGYYMEV